MLLVICNIMGKIYVFQLCNLNHTFSPTYLYIYQINHLREKVLRFNDPFVCESFFLKKMSYLRKVKQQANFLVFPLKFSENSHRHYLASEFQFYLSTCSRKLFQPPRVRISRMVRKAFLHYLSRSFIVQRNILRNYISIILC